jgi:hypothetical protein
MSEDLGFRRDIVRLRSPSSDIGRSPDLDRIATCRFPDQKVLVVAVEASLNHEPTRLGQPHGLSGLRGRRRRRSTKARSDLDRPGPPPTSHLAWHRARAVSPERRRLSRRLDRRLPRILERELRSVVERFGPAA